MPTTGIARQTTPDIVMAKQTKNTQTTGAQGTGTEAGGVAPLGAESKEQSAQKAKNDVFARVLLDGNPVALAQGTRIAPQAQVIVNTIEAAGSITRENLEKACTGVLVTRQPVGRIISYYQKDLVAAGLITLTKAA